MMLISPILTKSDINAACEEWTKTLMNVYKIPYQTKQLLSGQMTNHGLMGSYSVVVDPAFHYRRTQHTLVKLLDCGIIQR